MFLGATNAFHPETGQGNNPVTGEENQELNKIARNLKESGIGWVAVAEEISEKVPAENMQLWNPVIWDV